LFTAARVAVTTSVVGALLAEWLATGKGLGGQMAQDANEFEFARLWASVVVLTVVCVALYQVMSIIEGNRHQPPRGRPMNHPTHDTTIQRSKRCHHRGSTADHS